MPYESKTDKDRKLWITPSEAVAHVCEVERCKPTEAQDQILLALADQNIRTRWGDAVPVGHYKSGLAKFGGDSPRWGSEPYYWHDTIINWDEGTTYDPNIENDNCSRQSEAKHAGKKPPKLLDEVRPLLFLKRNVMKLWPTSTEFRPKASPNSETVPNVPAIGSQTRKPRKTDTAEDALLRNRIDQVIAAARAIDPKGAMDLRPLSEEVYQRNKRQGLKPGTVRKILAGRYPAQKRLGIAGLK